MTRTTWNFHTAGQLVFGFDATDSVGALIRRRGWDRVLVVTDPILRKLGIVDRVTQSLAAAKLSVEIFDGGEPEPSFAAAENAIQAAGEFRPGVILGLGGGSNMDLAKIVAAVTTHGGTYSDYFNFDRVPGPVMPLVCLPTTSGTGSEVSHAAVLTDTANEMKVSTLSNYLRPAIAVVDPALTMSCPRKVTADSGIDALTHAIEAYTATDSFAMDLAPGELGAYEGRFPLADCIAEKAIALVGQHLVTAVNEPANREAR
ncbi:MAG: iron-containing alcohol dehydrogenase, partial [Planctomycetales bacterium]|nr:iron-containing alcohol dehydrogenase [Planctomycetales bacterium]